MELSRCEILVGTAARTFAPLTNFSRATPPPPHDLIKAMQFFWDINFSDLDFSDLSFQDLQSWTKLDRTPCHMAEKRLLLPPFFLFNVAVMLSRTLTYMLAYSIDLGDGGKGKGPYQTDKVLQVNS